MIIKYYFNARMMCGWWSRFTYMHITFVICVYFTDCLRFSRVEISFYKITQVGDEGVYAGDEGVYAGDEGVYAGDVGE